MPKKPAGPDSVGPRSPSPLGGNATSFESVVQALGLAPEDFLDSVRLKEWVRQNKDHKYVPPDLLKAWGLIPDLDL